MEVHAVPAKVEVPKVAEKSLDSAEKQKLLALLDNVTGERDMLRRQLDEMHAAITPEVTVKNINHGLPFAIHHFKSMSDKNALLEAAVMSCDSNAILQVIFFLKVRKHGKISTSS